jgi:hypothetical protein
MHPESHLDIVRQRHSDLLREARADRLGERLGWARREERRTFLAWLQRKSNPCPPAAQQTSS